MTGKQTKSKKRVAGNIEVFTSEREVKAMADLERNQTQRIESRFLEPTCGTGNFLAQILNRKLTVVDKRYESAKTEWEFYAIFTAQAFRSTEPFQLQNITAPHFREWESKVKRLIKVLDY